MRSLRFLSPLTVFVGIILLAPGLPASGGFPGPNGDPFLSLGASQ